MGEISLNANIDTTRLKRGRMRGLARHRGTFHACDLVEHRLASLAPKGARHARARNTDQRST